MDNKTYVLDLDAIMNFVLKQDESRTSNSEITEMYAQEDESTDLTLVNKQLREVKNNGDVNTYTLRYDLIKTLIGALDEMTPENVTNRTLLQSMTFMTLLHNKLIKEIDKE